MTRQELVARLMSLDLHGTLRIMVTKGDLIALPTEELELLLGCYDDARNASYRAQKLLPNCVDN